MKITVNSQILAAELRILNQVAPEKASLPVLANVLIEAAEGLLRLSATDLEIACRTTCRASIVEPGRITLPAKKLLDIIEQLPDADVSITTDGPHVRIASGAFKGRLQAMPADDFPVLPEPSGVPQALPTAALQTMVGRVRYAITDKGKYTVGGALLTLTDAVAALVSTDGKRLALATMPHTLAAPPTILPTKTLDALQTVLSGPTVLFSQGERHLFFQAGERLLVSRTLDSQFPAYDRIIPRNSNKNAVVGRANLASALRRVGTMAEENAACYLAFTAEGITITSSSAQVGDAAEHVVCDYQGDPLRVCVSWQFVLDFLDAAIGQTITLELTNDASPVLLTDGSDHLAVVMLMRM